MEELVSAVRRETSTVCCKVRGLLCAVTRETIAQFAVRKRFAVWCKEREYIAQFAVRMRFAVWCKERDYRAVCCKEEVCLMLYGGRLSHSLL